MHLIIDGDVLAYQSCKPRWEQKVKKTGTHFVSLDDHGKKIPLEFTKRENQIYLEQSWDNFQEDLEKLKETLFTSDTLMAVKSGASFRDEMYPIILNEDGTKALSGYKANRWKPEGARNEFVPSLRELAIFDNLAVPAIGVEADDLLRIWANQAKAAGEDYIICSIDKDLHCIPGKHWLMAKKKLITVSPEEAMRHYYEQLLKGDPTDNIPGVPRLGDVKAARLVEGITSEEELQKCVVEQYLMAYGEDKWYEYLLANGKMIHLQRFPNDFFNFNEWPIVQELL